MERMQKGTMVQRRTMLQVCEQCVFFPLLLVEPLGDRMNASVAPMAGFFLVSGSESGCLAVVKVLSVRFLLSGASRYGIRRNG